jgi:hypothetical protein
VRRVKCEECLHSFVRRLPELLNKQIEEVYSLTLPIIQLRACGASECDKSPEVDHKVWTY